MASVTIRNLGEDTKQMLRERAARHGNSMEEELRMIVRTVISDNPASPVPKAENLYDSIRSLVDPDGGFDLALSHRSALAPSERTRILLIICGGIAAYKSLDLIRRLRERGYGVRAVMTQAAQQFVTPLSVGALTAEKVFTDLFSREDEQDVGHIRLARECDLVVVAPATADVMAKMAHGLAGDLASAVLLATDRQVLIAPAMNPAMWGHAATKRNSAALAKDGVHFIGPNKGEMAESGEAGDGRMAEPLEIVAAIEALLEVKSRPLGGKKIIVTSGPTHEPIDPVRYIANRSSGKQGHAIAAALAKLGADVRLVSGPVTIADPAGVNATHVETARQMLAAVEALLPADAAIMVAAVADWRTENEAGEKIKKQPGQGAPMLSMIENPDILKRVGHHASRPKLVIGFAAETQNLIANAKAKLARKGADMIVANDVSAESGIMGGDRNRVRIVSPTGVEEWPEMGKDEVAARLADLITARLASV
jgi:phosphopantothenoylcysteine decarboxylase / phosphopantothenate---cysteine ligase